MNTANFVLVFTILNSLDFCYSNQRTLLFSKYLRNELKTHSGAREKEDVLLLCKAETNSSTIQIKRLHDDNLLNTSRGSHQNLTYRIQSVTCDDQGIYECLIDQTHRSTVGVMLPDCPPLPCEDKAVNMTLFVDANEMVNFSLCVLMYDDISTYIQLNNSTVRKKSISSGWTWDYRESESTTNFIRNYTISVTRSNMAVEDYGCLSVRIFNHMVMNYYLGYNICIRPRGPPTCPTQLRVTKQGLDCIMLSWQPGLDGGSEQTFHVYYSKDNVTWSRHSLTHQKSSEIITGLLKNTVYFRVVPSNNFSNEINASSCENTVLGQTTLSGMLRETESSVEDQDTVATYLPPFVVIISAVILTVILAVRKEKKLRKKTFDRSTSTDSDLILLEHVT